MPQLITCPECGQSLRIKDELLGQQVRCPGCSVVIKTKKKPAPVEEVEEEEEEVEDDVPVKKPKKKKKVEEEGPPKKLIWAIVGGTVGILVIVIGGLLFLVFGTNLLTPATKAKPTQAPPTQASPPTTVGTTAPPTVSPPTEAPPADKWVRKLIPGTKVSVELPEGGGGLASELVGELGGLGGGGMVMGTQSIVGIPRIFMAQIAPDFTGGLEGAIDFIASTEEEAKKDMTVQILSRKPVQGRKALLFLRKSMGTMLQMYLVEGKDTIMFTVKGPGVTESATGVKRFLESIRFEK